MEPHPSYRPDVNSLRRRKNADARDKRGHHGGEAFDLVGRKTIPLCQVDSGSTRFDRDRYHRLRTIAKIPACYLAISLST
jgi:hypothetical protein